MGMFDFLNNNNPLKNMGPINNIVNPLSSLTTKPLNFEKGGAFNTIADPFGFSNGGFSKSFEKGQVFGRGGQINSMLDPAGIFGGNKGLSADQKMSKMLTGGLATASDDSAVQGMSKNQRDNGINSLGTTPKPIFPGADMAYDPETQGRPDYPGMSKSIWAGYNPRGGY